MASKTTNLPIIIACLVASSALFLAGNGLHPLWAFTWFAPVPVLWLAPRVSRVTASAVAFLAFAIGGLNEWPMANVVIPLPIFIISLLVPGCVFALVILLFRWRIRREALWQAVLIVPVTWVAYEFLVASTSPHSTSENLAYSQMNFLSILQVASITGIWGISFCIFLFASTVAAVLSEVKTRKTSLALAVGLFLVCILGFGFWRLATYPDGAPTVRIGLIASDASGNVFVREPNQAESLLRDYAAQADALAVQGAEVIVIPEKVAVLISSNATSIDHMFTDLASRRHVTIVVGVLHADGKAKWNEARIYSPGGKLQAVYDKHHMVPLFESNLTVGTSRVTFSHPSATWGVAICKDMDFPELSREYGQDGAALMLVPAWDFVADGWQHGRMAILRGIEDGFSIGRAPKQGILTLTDNRGRVIAERNTASAPFATVLATVPVHHDRTLYSRFGDWFAWLNVVTLFILLGMPLILRN